MSFPQYHEPTGIFDFSWIWISALILIAALVMFLVEKSKSKQGKAETATFTIWGVFLGALGAFSMFITVLVPSYALQARENAEAKKTYHSEIAKYIDSTYGIEISSDSAADLIDGKETAGVDPSGETITLSLLNRTQKEPVLIGTDHNPIPKFDELKAGSGD